MGAKYCVPCVVFQFYHWTRCWKLHHVRPRGLKDHAPSERPCSKRKTMLQSDFPPVHLLQVSFGHCRPLARRKYLLDQTCKYLLDQTCKYLLDQTCKYLLDQTCKCSTSLPNPTLHSCASSRVLVFFLWTRATYVWCLNRVDLSHVSCGMPWTVSHVSLTYFTTRKHSNADNFDNFRQQPGP